MPHYKIPNDKAPHFLPDDANPSEYLPEGFVLIDDNEAEVMRVASIPAPTEIEVRADRNARINAVAWRYERHAREIRLGITPSDDIAVLDRYIQELAGIPEQLGFPDNVKWPTL